MPPLFPIYWAIDVANPSMATNPLPEQQQQQQPGIYQQASSGGYHQGSGSIGPLFAVLSVITVLAALSCVLGRVCGGRMVGLDSENDCWGWMRWRCRRCIPDDFETGPKVVRNLDRNDKPEGDEQ